MNIDEETQTQTNKSSSMKRKRSLIFEKDAIIEKSIPISTVSLLDAAITEIALSQLSGLRCAALWEILSLQTGFVEFTHETSTGESLRRFVIETLCSDDDYFSSHFDPTIRIVTSDLESSGLCDEAINDVLIDTIDLDHDATQGRWLIAEKSLRLRVLGLNLTDEKLLKDDHLSILNAVARRREKGITVNELCKVLTVRFSKMYYLTSVLLELGLLFKGRSQTKNSINSYVFWLPRFAPPIVTLRPQILDITLAEKLLEQSPGLTLAAEDVAAALGWSSDRLSRAMSVLSNLSKKDSGIGGGGFASLMTGDSVLGGEDALELPSTSTSVLVDMDPNDSFGAQVDSSRLSVPLRVRNRARVVVGTTLTNPSASDETSKGTSSSHSNSLLDSSLSTSTYCFTLSPPFLPDLALKGDDTHSKIDSFDNTKKSKTLSLKLTDPLSIAAIQLASPASINADWAWFRGHSSIYQAPSTYSSFLTGAAAHHISTTSAGQINILESSSRIGPVALSTDGDFLPLPELPPEVLTPSSDAHITCVPFEQSSDEILFRMILRAGSDSVTTSAFRALSGIRTKRTASIFSEMLDYGVIRASKKSKATTYSNGCGGGTGGGEETEIVNEKYAVALRTLLVDPFSPSALDMIKQAQDAVERAQKSKRVSFAQGLLKLPTPSDPNDLLSLSDHSIRIETGLITADPIVTTTMTTTMIEDVEVPSPAQMASQAQALALPLPSSVINPSYWMVMENAGGSIASSGELCIQLPRISLPEATKIPKIKEFTAPYVTNVGSAALKTFSHRIVVLDRSTDHSSSKVLGFASEINLLALPDIKQSTTRKVFSSKPLKKRLADEREYEDQDEDEEEQVDAKNDDDIDSIDLFNSFIEAEGKSLQSSPLSKHSVKKVRGVRGGKVGSARTGAFFSVRSGKTTIESIFGDDAKDGFEKKLIKMYRDYKSDILSVFSSGALAAGPSITRLEAELRSKAVPAVKSVTLAMRDSATYGRFTRKEIKRIVNRFKTAKTACVRLIEEPLSEIPVSFASKFTLEKDPLRKTRRRYDWTRADETALLQLHATDRAQRELLCQVEFILEHVRYLQLKHETLYLRSIGDRLGTLLTHTFDRANEKSDEPAKDENRAQIELTNNFFSSIDAHGGDNAFSDEQIIILPPDPSTTTETPLPEDMSSFSMVDTNVVEQSSTVSMMKLASPAPLIVPEKANNLNLDVCVRCFEPSELFCCDKCVRSFCCPCYGVVNPPPEDPWVCGECDKPISKEAQRAHDDFVASVAAGSRGTSPLFEDLIPEDDENDNDDDDENVSSTSKKESLSHKLRNSALNIAVSDKVASLFNSESWFGVPLIKNLPVPKLQRTFIHWNRVAKALAIDEEAAKRRFKIVLKSTTNVNLGNDFLSQERSRLGVKIYRDALIGRPLQLARAQQSTSGAVENLEEDVDNDDINGIRQVEETEASAAMRKQLILGGKGLDHHFGHLSTQAAFGGQVTGDAAGRSVVYSLWPGLSGAELMLLTKTLNALINDSFCPITSSELADEYKPGKTLLKDATSELNEWLIKSQKRPVSVIQLFRRMRLLGWLRQARSSLKKESLSLTEVSSYFWQTCFPGATSHDTTQAVIDQLVSFSEKTTKLNEKLECNEEEESSNLEIGFDPPLGAPGSVIPSVISDFLSSSSSSLFSSSTTSSSATSSSSLSYPQLRIEPSIDEKNRILRYLESKCGKINFLSASTGAIGGEEDQTQTQMSLEDTDSVFTSSSSSSSSSSFKPNTLFTTSSRGVGTLLDKISILRKDPSALNTVQEPGVEDGTGILVPGIVAGPTSVSKRKEQMADIVGWKLILDARRFSKQTTVLRDAIFKGITPPTRDVWNIFSRAIEAAKVHMSTVVDDVIASGPLGLEIRSLRSFIEFRLQQKIKSKQKIKHSIIVGEKSLGNNNIDEELNAESNNDDFDVHVEKDLKLISSFTKYLPFVQDIALRLLLQQPSSLFSNSEVDIIRAVPFDCDIFVNVSAKNGFRKLYTQACRRKSTKDDQKKDIDTMNDDDDDDNNNDNDDIPSPIFIWSSLSPSRYNASTLIVLFRHIFHLVLKRPYIDEASIIRNTPASPPGNTRMILRFLSRIGMFRRSFRLAQDAETVFSKPSLYSRDLAPWEDEVDMDTRGEEVSTGDERLAESSFLSTLHESLPKCIEHATSLRDAVLLWEDATYIISKQHSLVNTSPGIDLVTKLESQPSSECPISGGIITEYCATSMSQLILGMLGQYLSVD